MAIATKVPTGDIEYAGTWDKTVSMYSYVDDWPDSGTPPADYLQHGTTAGYVTFSYPNFAIPAGSTINSVQVLMYVYEATSGANRLYARLRVGGNIYNSSVYENPTTTNTLYTFTWAANPKSGVAWTVDDVNGVGANALSGFGTYTTDANPAWRLASIEVVVNYTVAPQYGAAAITSTATLTASAVVIPVKMASASITCQATVDAIGTRVQYGLASITSVASLSATAMQANVLYAQATLASLAVLSAHALAPSMSTYLANKLLDHCLGEGARNYTPPTLYLSLHTASPGDAGANEWTDANYARQGVDFGASASGTAISSVETQFPKPAVEATITHWGLWDAQANGNYLLGGPLISSAMPTTRAPTLVAGEVKVVVE